MTDKLDALFQKAVDSKSLPGIAAAIYDASGKAVYSKAFGKNNVDDDSAKPYTTSTQTLMFSTTKLIASVAALQLIEQGKLSLTDPAEKYVPEIAKIQVIDGKDSDGKFKLRAAKTKPTILNLITHTAGFTYDFFDHDTLAWRIGQGQAPAPYLGVGSWEAFQTPLAHDPGEKYTYGINIDWLGFVIEAVSGKPLNVYVDENILHPLGLKNTTTNFIDDANRLVAHTRDEAGKLTPGPQFVPAEKPDRYGGGHYLVSTLDDYCQFLLAIVNEGTHPVSKVEILKKETVRDYVFRDFIPEVGCSPSTIGDIATSIPQLSAEGKMLPGVDLGWSCGLMLNNEDVPNGRKAGSGAWAGLGNLYYWVDPKAGKLGMIITSVLPFFDEKSLELFDALEKAAYGNEVGKQKTYEMKKATSSSVDEVEKKLSDVSVSKD